MATTPFVELPSSASRAALRSVYLERLQRLLRLRGQHERDLNAQGLRLLNRSIFTAYCDCREVGAGEEARRILRRAKFALGQPALPLRMHDVGPR